MTHICGIELKASEAIMVLLEVGTEMAMLVDVEPKRIKLVDDESSSQITGFHQAIVSFVKDYSVDTVVIKKRAKKGNMAGGAISFKLEALIQLNGLAQVAFVSGQGIAAAHKKNPFIVPEKLKKYQQGAFMAASLFLRQYNEKRSR